MEYSIENWLAVLGLGAGATAAQIKEAYRDLTKVWHPDRFAHDPRLRTKAEEKLKQLNEAHDALLSHATADGCHHPVREDGRQRAGTAHTLDGMRSRPGSTNRVRNRHVRMPVPRVAVHFGDRIGQLINLSITGGQLLLDFAPEVDSRATLLLQANGQSLDLSARVLRVTPATPAEPLDASAPLWAVSVTFVNLSPQARQSIPRIYNLLIGAGRKAAGSAMRP